MPEYIPIADVDTLKRNGAFCILPWVHVHQSPNGTVGACCIAQHGPVMHENKVEHLVNSEYMANLRKDMLAGVKNPTCDICYGHEEQFGSSNRLSQFETFEDTILEDISTTRTNGVIDNFKMRWFDIRFNNVCNMKCRSCGPGYSSLWEAEQKKHDIPHDFLDRGPDIMVKETQLIDDVLENYVDHIERAYFAGGEPLVSDEHYAILSKLIELGKTDIFLSYNTNMSILDFKNHDVLSMWDNFTQVIDISASIDHVGKRAEYIRKGTKWNQVHNNLKRLAERNHVLHNRIVLSFNCVVSIYNYLTLDEFIKTLVTDRILIPVDEYDPGANQQQHVGLYPLHQPNWMCAQNLPKHMKQQGREKLEALVDWLIAQGFKEDFETINHIRDIMNFVEQEDTWEQNKEWFKSTSEYYDNIRDENFLETFPELAELYNE